MSICYSTDCNNHYDNMMAQADEAEELRQKKIKDDYDNIDIDDFTIAMSHAYDQDYINMFDAFKNKDAVAMKDAVEKTLLNYIEFFHPEN